MSNFAATARQATVMGFFIKHFITHRNIIPNNSTGYEKPNRKFIWHAEMENNNLLNNTRCMIRQHGRKLEKRRKSRRKKEKIPTRFSNFPPKKKVRKKFEKVRE